MQLFAQANTRQDNLPKRGLHLDVETPINSNRNMNHLASLNYNDINRFTYNPSFSTLVI